MRPNLDLPTIESLNTYVRDLYATEDELLEEIREETKRQDMPVINIRPEEGRMLQLLIATIGAKKIVELGTLAGYSGLWLARALPPDGILYTLDINPKHAEVAGKFFARANLSDRIEQLVGNGHEVLLDLSAKGPFDMLFIDAEKSGYPAYLEWGLTNVRSGGLILAHNAFSNGRVTDPQYDTDENILGLREYNRTVAAHHKLVSTIIPVGDGITASVVRS